MPSRYDLNTDSVVPFVATPEDQAFYERVYPGASFPIGRQVLHHTFLPTNNLSFDDSIRLSNERAETPQSFAARHPVQFSYDPGQFAPTQWQAIQGGNNISPPLNFANSAQSQYPGVNAYQPNAILSRQWTTRYIDNSPEPASSPRRPAERDINAYFIVRDESDQQFINRVYNDYTPAIGDYVTHRNFVVTEEYCIGDDLEFITYLRLRTGIDAEGRNIRPKLPREPVEALPLPG